MVAALTLIEAMTVSRVVTDQALSNAILRNAEDSITGSQTTGGKKAKGAACLSPHSAKTYENPVRGTACRKTDDFLVSCRHLSFELRRSQKTSEFPRIDPNPEIRRMPQSLPAI
jgi:hypothetical protein